MALGQTDGLCQFLNRGELTGIHAPPPPPCAADGTQDVRGLRLILAGYLLPANWSGLIERVRLI